MNKVGPIGVFDSGYGGLTVLQEFMRVLPDYDYLYLGDNARAPYGNRSFEVVHEFTLEAVNYLKNQGCRLVILACNTSSAKALRTLELGFCFSHAELVDRLQARGLGRTHATYRDELLGGCRQQCLYTAKLFQ